MSAQSGIRMTLLIGPLLPAPAPFSVIRALDSAQVSYTAAGNMSFGMTFRVGRGGAGDSLDYDLVRTGLFKAFNRIGLVLFVAARPLILMDGIITNIQLNPSNQPGASTLTVIGEDLSVMMSLAQKARAFPAMNDGDAVAAILVPYARYRLRGFISAPLVRRAQPPTATVPLQVGTDLDHVRKLAARNGYVFYVYPDPLGTGPVAYWGPPKRLSVPQPALSIALGASSTVEKLDFEFDALAPHRTEGYVMDATTGMGVPVKAVTGTDVPTTRTSAWQAVGSNARVVRYVNSGQQLAQATAEAMARTTASARRAVTAKGELDTERYGHVLLPYQPVGVRGAGGDFDGTYTVGSVTHLIKPGSYRQRFTLQREGTGALLPVVRP